MLVEITRSVRLPDHPDAEGERKCHMCGEGIMIPFEGDSTYGHVRVCNIHGWHCMECGEDLLTSDEVKLIEEALKEGDIYEKLS